MGLDGFAFVVSFKGVYLEGLEVAFIVLTFGADGGQHPASRLQVRPSPVAGRLVVGAVGRIGRCRGCRRTPSNTASASC